jgi:hypothetical protein
MTTSYDCMHPYQQLQMLNAERLHLRSLYEAAGAWQRAVDLVNATATQLNNRKTSLLNEAWHDDASRSFGDEVNKSLRSMQDWATVVVRSGVVGHINHLILQFPNIYNEMVAMCRGFQTAERLGQLNNYNFFSFCRRAGEISIKVDRHYEPITAAMKKIEAEAPDWAGPRAAIPGPAPAPGVPGSTPSSTGTGSPGAPGTPEPATVPEPQPAEVPENAVPGEPRQATDALGAAANAVQAAQGLLGGTQIPDAISLPEVEEFNPGEVPYGQPELAGLDPAAFGGGAAGSAGGVSGVGTSPTGPGGAVGAGTPPAQGDLARGMSAGAGTGAPPPMYPPNSGAAGNRSAAAGIKPGNSDRPAAQSRPRPRRGTPSTPGVALAGRAGAAAPTPAARRSWDSDNDSLQVLDEHLWQVTPQEEETHGQDRRRPGSDGRDRTAAHRAPDAGLAGPGGRADQPTRAR